MSDTRTSKAVNALYQKRPINVPKETYKCTKRDNTYQTHARAKWSTYFEVASMSIAVPKETYKCAKRDI